MDEFVVPRGAETVWTYAEGLTADHSAVTRHRLGEGTAWYVSTRLDAHGLDALLGWATEDARIARAPTCRTTSKSCAEKASRGSFLFAVNHSASDVKVPLGRRRTELLTGERAAGGLAVPAGAVRVVRSTAEPKHFPSARARAVKPRCEGDVLVSGRAVFRACGSVRPRRCGSALTGPGVSGRVPSRRESGRTRQAVRRRRFTKC